MAAWFSCGFFSPIAGEKGYDKMHKSVQNFILTAKAIALADAQKHAKARYIESEFESTKENTIFNQQKFIDLLATDFERIDIASQQLEKAREHLLGAMAALNGFDGISKSELLLAANFTNGYIYMLGEFMRQKQERTAKPVRGMVGLNG
jgi:hypothetical protein